MNRNSIGIAAVFLAFLIPMLLLSMINNGARGTIAGRESATALSPEVVKAHIVDGRLYSLSSDRALRIDGVFDRRLPRGAVDFHVQGKDVFALTNQCLYQNDRVVWPLDPRPSVEPEALVIVGTTPPEAHIVFSDGTHIERSLRDSGGTFCTPSGGNPVACVGSH